MVVQVDHWSLDGSIKTNIEPLSDNANLHDMLTDDDNIAKDHENNGTLLCTEINNVNRSPHMIADVDDFHYLSQQRNHFALKPPHCLEHGAQPAVDRDEVSFDLTSSSLQSIGIHLSAFHNTRPLSFDGYIQTGMPVDDKQTSISDKSSFVRQEVVAFEGAENSEFFPGSNASLQTLEDDDLEVDAGCNFRDCSGEGPDILHLVQFPTHVQQAMPHVTNGRLQDTNMKLQDAVHRLSSPSAQPGDFQGQFGNDYIRTDHLLTGIPVTTDVDEEMLCDIDDFGYILQKF